MTGGFWHGEQFRSELTSALAAMLAGARGADTLKRAVADSAAAAEVVCRNRPAACGPGCPHCCVLNVSILLPEGLVIADWLKEQLSSARLDKVRQHLSDHRKRVRWMADEERIFQRVACPLLDASGNCSIHPVRPLACHGVASLDRDSCRDAFRPTNFDEERLVVADLLRRAAFDAAFMALAKALEQNGLDNRSIELGAGILAFLDRSEVRELFLSAGRLPQEYWE